MKKLMMLGVMIAVFGLGTAAALAAGSDAPSSPPGQSNDQVCPGGDSGKIDVSGNHASVTVTAPDGRLTSGYCVKAGSANQGLGPEFHTVSPAAKSVTITHSSGKDVSHYSLTFVAEETPPTETTPTETTPTETTPTETTPTETTPTETTPTETTSTQADPPETTSTQEEQQDPAEAQPTVVAGVKATVARPSKAPQAVDAGTSATRPSTAPQAAPFTP